MPLSSRYYVPPPNPLAQVEGVPLHFAGVLGKGMEPLALAARWLGADVDGCDRRLYTSAERLGRAGIEVSRGHDSRHAQDRRVVTSTAVGLDVPEVHMAQSCGQLHHRTDLLNAVAARRLAITVTGTHGKGTVASMITYALVHAGEDPLAILGLDAGLEGGFRPGSGVAVLEADDADGTIDRVRSDIAIVTNSWFDHVTFGRSRLEVLNDICSHAAGVAHDGHVILGRSPRLEPVRQASRPSAWQLGRDFEVETISVNDHGRDLRLIDPVTSNAVTARIELPGGGVTDNAALAFAGLRARGLTPSEASASVGALTTLPRRLQRLGCVGGITVYDDIGKHPASLYAGMQELRERHPDARLHVVFEPAESLLVTVWQRQWLAVLSTADRAQVLAPPADSESSEADELTLSQWVGVRERRVEFSRSHSDARAAVLAACVSGDVVLFAGLRSAIARSAKAFVSSLA